MVRVDVHDQVKRALQNLVAPELHAIRGDIRLLDQQIDGVDARLTTRSILSGPRPSCSRGRCSRRSGGSTDRQLRTAIDIHERLAALEARRTS